MLARKSKWKTGLIIVGMLAPALLIAVGIVIYPVSYTHLDVYKRQSLFTAF